MSHKLPPITEVPKLSTEDRASILDQLFEPCPQLHTLSVSLLSDKTFPSYGDLIASIGVQLTELSESTSTSDTAWLESILCAHPRLGEKKVDSEQSRAEQAQLNTGGEAEAERLRSFNAEYEQTFPGLRYVYARSPRSIPHVAVLITICRVFVNGRSRPVIMEDMKQRIERGNIEMERADAIKVISSLDGSSLSD
jgi:2-oxo-4-hydroxy-4-carboxy--5-ureidoimidazoline (OHCU) decarboxylase